MNLTSSNGHANQIKEDICTEDKGPFVYNYSRNKKVYMVYETTFTRESFGDK